MGIDYSKLNKLIIPKHKDHHWALIVVNFPEKTFEYYDSLSEENVDHDIKVNPLILQQLILKVIQQFLFDLNIDSQDWKSTFINRPKQSNFIDCGVFACVHSYFQMKGINKNYLFLIV
jgi:Ulp1 family protease